MTTVADVKNWIEGSLIGAEAEVMGDGRHFEAQVVCAGFAGKSTLQRHRMVYDALGDHMKSDIHALSLQTITADQAK